jgi:hypothetical protein
MSSVKRFFIGIILMIAGFYLLLSNIKVSTFGFYTFGGVNSAPILLILLFVLIVISVIHSRWYTWGLVGLNVLAIIGSVIMGTRFVFKTVTMLELIAMLGCLAIGLGFFISSLFGLNKEDKKK